jgi:PhoPQ-activated pathogenicity-related protein
MIALLLGLAGGTQLLHAGALETYVNAPDTHFSWKQKEQTQADGFTVTSLDLVSQQWHENLWQHSLQVVRPDKMRNPTIAFLFITGDGRGTSQLPMLKILAERAGAVAAVVTGIPNQPLYDGRKEDALIAYTLDQYLKTGDETWPLLFPMVKTAVRAMDAVQAFVLQENREKIQGFVVAGASKRGWTTWLTAAVDARVKGIAPMVIDTLNMRAQNRWAEKVYGRQSEEIRDYVELGLVKKEESPAMAVVREWIDPYAYRQRYNMPKLLLLGTNDPYWTVDSLRHYWKDLPTPKLIFQTPNAGHDLAGAKEAVQSLAAFFQMIADGRPLPQMEWRFQEEGTKVRVSAKVSQPAKIIRLWTAESPDRDFRNDKWTSRDLEVQSGSSQAATEVITPDKGYRAYLLEAVLTSPTGQEYKLSTEARVTPDDIK